MATTDRTFGGTPPGNFRLFPLPPDWTKGITEKISYMTDVLVGYSDAEQRRSLRSNPRRGLSFSILTMNERETALFDSLIFGWMQNPFGVPWWPDAQFLPADVAQCSDVVPIATADRLFANGGLAVIWQNAANYEVLAVDVVSANNFTLSTPTQFSWEAGNAIVAPVFLARLPDKFDVSRWSSGGISADLDFAGEAGQIAPSFAATSPQYRGIDVLDCSPNWSEAAKRTMKRSLVVLDSETGDITVEAKSVSPVPSAPLNLWLDGHDQVAAFRAFLDRRLGRLAPFWAPTWDQILLLLFDIAPTSSTITIQESGYTRYLFPSVARHDLAFIAADGSRHYARVTASVENGDGTETLSFAGPLGFTLQASQTQVSFLTLCRLDADEIDLSWPTSDHADVALATAEIPREVPL